MYTLRVDGKAWMECGLREGGNNMTRAVRALRTEGGQGGTNALWQEIAGQIAMRSPGDRT